MTLFARVYAILGHVPYAAFVEERIQMSMPNSIKEWTLEDLHRLPDDGNKYELVDSELFVTPAPRQPHEIVLARLTRLLDPYVAANGLGLTLHRGVIQFRGSWVEPDLMVRAEPDDVNGKWENAPTPILVVEVVSPTTWRRDHIMKREFYCEAAVSEYWIVDMENRFVRVVRPGVEDIVATDELAWSPRLSSPRFVLRLADLFSGLRVVDE